VELQPQPIQTRHARHARDRLSYFSEAPNSKQQTGVGQARNRLPKAVERTVPFGMIVQSMIIAWYALYGYDPADVTDRAIAQPWYRTKTEPAFEDMILKLRKTIITARSTTATPGQPDPDLLHDYALACAAAAA